MDALQELYEDESDVLQDYGESQLLNAWIGPVLDILGFETLSETTLPGGGGRVDRVLFETADDRRDAAAAKSDGRSDATFGRSLAIVEAKQWGNDFTSRFSDQRPYRDASHQIKHYLERTPDSVQWGILTDGKRWRLYGTKDYETETFYEVNLPELLERDSVEAFKRFYVFFRAAAFHEVGGTTFLDRVWSESETAAQELGEDLQDNVFTALRVLAEGFVETNDLDLEPDDNDTLDELKQQSLVLLYRLMFLLYAESRGLIHPEDPASQSTYEEHFSIEGLRETVHEAVGERAATDRGVFAREFTEYSHEMWDRLTRLFELVDEGAEDLGIPPYNGGLFDRERHAFLAEHEIADPYVAEVVHLVSTTESEQTGETVFADYADLDTRHLGSIYEGLLEHQFRVAPEAYAAVREDGGQAWKPATEVSVADAVETVERGDLYVVNDDGERKATGAYYTPDYVVTYIIEETVDPLLAEIRDDLRDDGLESGDPQFYTRFRSRVLDLNVLDPAMGSGHFLTKATGYLAEQVMNEARELASAGGINEQEVRRAISKECIYGVDLNGMAVELAKLSMWLETLATDQPLAFLDHHLKTGNSIVGSDIETIEALKTGRSEDRPDDESVLGEFLDTRQGTIEDLMRIYEDFLAIENEDLNDVKAMERKYREIEQDDLRRRLVAMANVRTAEDFGVEVSTEGDRNPYEWMAQALEDDGAWAGVEATDWYKTGQSLAAEHDFFHWKLEFPEVFYDADGTGAERSGFDAVVGNPPYVRIYGDRLPEEIVEYYRSAYESAYKKFDLYVLFLDLALDLVHENGITSQIVPDKFLNTPYGEKLRNKIFETSQIHSILDLRDTSVFKDASVSNVIPVFGGAVDQDAEISIRTKEEMDFPEINRASLDLLTTGSDNSLRLRVKQGDLSILDKISKNSIRFDDVYYVNWGLRTGTTEKTNKYVVEETDDQRAEPMIRGQDIADRYRLLPPSEYVIYAPDDFYNPMFPELFENPKLVFRKISGEGIMAVADENGYYCFSTLIPCVNIRNVSHLNRSGIPNETPESGQYDDLYFALAMVNSKLTAWYYYKTLSDELSVVPGHVSELPLPEIEFDNGSITKEQLERIDEKAIQGDTKGAIQQLASANDDVISPDAAGYRSLSYFAENMSEYQNTHTSLNLHLPDYLGAYDDGPTLADLAPMPVSGIADSILTETTETRDNLRVGSVEIKRDRDTVTVHLSARYKPEDEDAFETDRWGYTETDLEPALRFRDLDDAQAALVAAFVPYAIEEADGFADFREMATKTNSLVDRLEALTLPTLSDVRDGVERYEATIERAAELDEKIERTDALIDELVYELYGLTDEEIETVEGAIIS
jgi:type I restriction-modification system DNA methylase subunit